MNRVMTGGQHERRRRPSSRRCCLPGWPGICWMRGPGGTGDIGFEAMRLLRMCMSPGVDLTDEMMLVGQRKADREGLLDAAWFCALLPYAGRAQLTLS